MKCWNDQLVTPSPELLTATDGEHFFRLSNGWYFTIKKTIDDAALPYGLVAYALIPVKSEFFIETDYLPKKFVFSKTADKSILISDKDTEFPVRSATGETIFYLDKKASGAVPHNDLRTILLRMTPVL